MFLKLLEKKHLMYVLKNKYHFKYIQEFLLKAINDADPELKGTRRLLSKQNQPTLSEVRISQI
jgi:hypothetical protein